MTDQTIGKIEQLTDEPHGTHQQTAQRLSKSREHLVETLGLLAVEQERTVALRKALGDLVADITKARDYRITHSELDADILLYDTVDMMADSATAARKLLALPAAEKAGA